MEASPDSLICKKTIFVFISNGLNSKLIFWLPACFWTIQKLNAIRKLNRPYHSNTEQVWYSSPHCCIVKDRIKYITFTPIPSQSFSCPISRLIDFSFYFDITYRCSEPPWHKPDHGHNLWWQGDVGKAESFGNFGNFHLVLVERVRVQQGHRETQNAWNKYFWLTGSLVYDE